VAKYVLYVGSPLGGILDVDMSQNVREFSFLVKLASEY